MQAQDAINRLQRMRYAAEQCHLVIGAEDECWRHRFFPWRCYRQNLGR